MLRANGELFMSNNVYGLAIVLLVMVVVNKLMAIPQTRKLNKQLFELKKTGPISSVGLAKHWTGSHAYVLITDMSGNILSGHSTSGITVFSGFKKDKGLIEKHYSQIIENLSQKKKLNKKLQAKLMAANFIEEGLRKNSEAYNESIDIV